jgi:hypothetical protein
VEALFIAVMVLLVAGVLTKSGKLVGMGAILGVLLVLLHTGLPTKENLKHLSIGHDDNGGITVHDGAKTITIPRSVAP